MAYDGSRNNSQKEEIAKKIVSMIHNQQPPGRFLKQDPTTRLYHLQGEENALEKARQALRDAIRDGKPVTATKKKDNQYRKKCRKRVSDAGKANQHDNSGSTAS